MKKAIEYFRRFFVKQTAKFPGLTTDEMIELIWIQKTFDDCCAMLGSINSQMKGANRFNPTLLKERDKLNHDIARLQPILVQQGIRMAKRVEQKYDVDFSILAGRELVAPPSEQEKKEGKQILIHPGKT